MTLEDGLKIFLATGLSTSRVYSHKAPQPLPAPAGDPYIVIYRISANPDHMHIGPSPSIERTIQFSCFAKGQSAALALSDQVRRLLDGYRGLAGDVPMVALWAGDTYSYDDATTWHGAAVDMRIRYREE